MWPHAFHNCVPVRIIHARDLSNSIITLTSNGQTWLFSRFRLVSNKIRPACVAPQVIETEKKKKTTTEYQLPTKKMKYFNKKSKVTILTYIHMGSFEYEYFGSARTPVTKSSIYKGSGRAGARGPRPSSVKDDLRRQGHSEKRKPYQVRSCGVLR